MSVSNLLIFLNSESSVHSRKGVVRLVWMVRGYNTGKM